MTEHDEENAPQEELEIDFDAEDDLGDIGVAKAKIKKLRDELERIKKERQEYLDGWQRCKADSVNMRKDVTLMAESGTARKLLAFAEDILPALDSFDMAKGSESWTSIDDGWRNGMENVLNQLLEALRRNGIDRYGKVGDMYDPFVHEAVQEIDDVAGKSGEIVRILRFGYRNGERVVRPAQVIIKK